jgi:sulfite reductase (ferredoxin)
LGNGEGKIADKVIKVPSKRGPEVLRVVLNNFEENSNEGEYFYQYYDRQGEKYFYNLLKPLADLSQLKEDEFIDWGAADAFYTEIGVGECAGVMIDLVATLLFESEEKFTWCQGALADKRWADAIYHAYSVFISSAKALLLDKSVSVSNQMAVINRFDENFVQTEEFTISKNNFSELVLQINQNEPNEEFALAYSKEAFEFLQNAILYRQQLAAN